VAKKTKSDITNNKDCIDINREPLRERSNSLSANFSSEASTYSSVLSIPYVERIEIQNNDSSWVNQVEESK